MKKNTMDMTTGSVTKKLLVFVFPLIITNMLQHLYNAADSAVVGQFSGKVALAAVGATSSATSLITNLLIGLAVGANIINSNLLGSKDYTGLRRSMHTGISIGGLFGVVLGLIGILLARPLLQLMNCPDNVIDHSVTYMRIIFCGTPGSMLYNFGAGILRTHGDSKRPMVIISTCGLVNVALNLVFVIIFKMSVAGVALATIISNYLSAVWVLKILFDPNGEYKLSVKELTIHKTEFVNIVKVGIPCAINSMMFNISTAIVASSANTFGDTMVAASTASVNITNILVQVISAFYSAAISFTGQCYGAGKFKRIDQIAVIGTAICVGLVSLAAAVITVIPQFFIGLFNTDPGVIEVGSQKLTLMSWSFVLYGLSDICLGCLRGIKKTAIPTAMNIFCVCIIRILWVMFIFPLNPNSFMLLQWCYPVSYICSSISLIGYYLYCRKKYFTPEAKTV